MAVWKPPIKPKGPGWLNDKEIQLILREIERDKKRNKPHLPFDPVADERARIAKEEYDEAMKAQRIMEKIEKGK